MQITLFGKRRPVWVAVLAVVALTALFYTQFLLKLNREVTLLCAIAMIFLFARDDLKRLWNLPSVLLLGYVAYTAISAFWAVAGKFHLTQFVKLFPATLVFVVLVLRGRAEKAFVRSVMGVVTYVSAIIAFLSLEGASTGFLNHFVYDVLNISGITMSFNGQRLFGAFGNSNVEASVFAIGVFFSLALLHEAESRRERVFRIAVLVFNAFAFVLVFSMGAILCFAVAVGVYLAVSGGERGRALSLMLITALPTLLFAFISTRFFNASGVLKLLPLLLPLLNAAVVAVLDETIGERLGKTLAAHEKVLYGTLLVGVILLAAYILLALRLGAPYTFGGPLNRVVTVAPGEHTLRIDADGPVEVSITSINSVQVLTGDFNSLYNGAAADAAFTVPADSVETRFFFTAGEGVTLRSAAVDGEEPLMLRYRLLPSFIANRLQGTLSTSSSAMLRVTLWRTGLRYWLLSPVFGNGYGSFESGISQVMEFDYETKFPHNHYIRVLLEGGVIAFALFFGALFALGAALWKRRRALRETGFAVLFAAFVAEFTMNALQIIWDLSMSNIIFLSETFAFYALIVLLCAEPLGRRKQVEAADAANEAAADAAKEDGKNAAKDGKGRKKTVKEERRTAAKSGKGRKAAAKDSVPAEVRAACMLLPIFVGLTFLGNIISQHLLYDFPETLGMYLKNLELATKIDLYERNDAYATYITQVSNYGAYEHLEQANEYAVQLSKGPSNSSSIILVEYYVNTQQFSQAIDMALKGAVYGASDTGLWNSNIDLLKQCFADTGAYSPLLTDDGELLGKLLVYRAAWEERNAFSLSPVTLTVDNEIFFQELLELEACGGDMEEKLSVLTKYQPYPENVDVDPNDYDFK